VDFFSVTNENYRQTKPKIPKSPRHIHVLDWQDLTQILKKSILESGLKVMLSSYIYFKSTEQQQAALLGGRTTSNYSISFKRNVEVLSYCVSPLARRMGRIS
jgi:hypothetical protein